VVLERPEEGGAKEDQPAYTDRDPEAGHEEADSDADGTGPVKNVPGLWAAELSVRRELLDERRDGSRFHAVNT